MEAGRVAGRARQRPHLDTVPQQRKAHRRAHESVAATDENARAHAAAHARVARRAAEVSARRACEKSCDNERTALQTGGPPNAIADSIRHDGPPLPSSARIIRRGSSRSSGSQMALTATKGSPARAATA